MRQKSSIHPSHFGLVPGARPMRAWPKRRSTSSWDGQFASAKALGSSWFEGFLERDFQTHLEADATIKAYSVQAHQLIYWAPDETGEFAKRLYTPDVAAIGVDGEILVFEVKAKAFRQQEKWLRLEPFIREAYAADHGARFSVFTETEIRAQPRLTNLEIMLRHRPPGNDELGELVVRTLIAQTGGRTTLGAIAEAAVAQAIEDRRSFSALMRLALCGAIKLDLSQPFSPQTLVEVAV
jgi:hypothetical protein